MKRLAIGAAGLFIAMQVNTIMMGAGWNVALRTVVCFFIGVAVMLGYRWAEKRKQ
jgi:uncharacterized membrane protein YccC